ncbi:putative HTH-type transcriptional regulator YdeC [Bienertia sinuspersici]
MKGNKSTAVILAEKCKNILASNWQGHLNTIKADSKGSCLMICFDAHLHFISKQEIYTSKVKYMLRKGKPYIWVPEKDLHNVAILDNSIKPVYKPPSQFTYQRSQPSGIAAYRPPTTSGTKRPGSKYYCTHCQIPGHSYDRCFKVHGFAPGFKGFQEKRFAAVVNSGENVNSPITAQTPLITAEQYNQLMSLLNKHQPIDTSDATPYKTDTEGKEFDVFALAIPDARYRMMIEALLMLLAMGENNNTIIDERASFSVPRPYPGALANILRSIEKLPVRIALTGEVVPLRDEKVSSASEGLRDMIMSEQRKIVESSYAVSGILSSSTFGNTSRSESLVELLDNDKYVVYKFNVR